MEETVEDVVASKRGRAEDAARYTLQELADIDIDLWVNAISSLAEKYGHEIDGFKDDMDECPAVYEHEFTQFSEERGIRYDGSGKILED